MSIFSEEKLRAVSKQFGTLVPRTSPITDTDAEACLQDLLGQLLFTVEEQQLQAKHRAAACNALCGLVDTLVSSKVLEIKTLALNDKVWDRLRKFFLNRYQDASTRSMAQWLSTLQGMLAEHRNSTDRTVKWEDEACKTCIKIISSSSHLNSVKPSVLFLEMLLAKGLIECELFVQFLHTIQHQQRILQEEGIDQMDEFEDEDDQNQQSPSDMALGKTPPGLLPGKIPGLIDHFDIQHALQQLVVELLRWTKQIDIASIAGRFLRTIFKIRVSLSVPVTEIGDGSIQGGHNQSPAWLYFIQDLASEDFSDIEKLAKHILPELLACSEDEMLRLIRTLPFHNLLQGTTGSIVKPEAYLVQVRLVLQFAKIISKMELSPQLSSQWQEIRMPVSELPEKLAVSCITHQSPVIRISALEMIVTADGTTRPFSVHALQALKQVIRTLFFESDAKIRGDVSSILKKLTERLHLVIRKLGKDEVSPDQTRVTDPKTLAAALQHGEFVAWFLDFLCAELRPSASYQRHVLALKTLNMASTRDLFDSCKVQMFTFEMITELVHLVLDAFDDVRSLSAALLTHAAPLDKDLFDPKNETSCIAIAKYRMMLTGRANISDGYARLLALSFYRTVDEPDGEVILSTVTQSLLAQLDDELLAAERNLRDVVAKPKLHGQFISLKYIVDSTRTRDPRRTDKVWIEFVQILCIYCLRAWDIVKPVLCIDSPEGHEDEEEISDLEIGVKDTLSFSWRTLKETSALLQAVLENRPLNINDYQIIGDLCFTQLSELRHRGAFSTVAQCFTSCCIQTQQSGSEEGWNLIQGWYQKLLQLIDVQSAVLTRRSAGLPALCVALLSSDPSWKFLNKATQELQIIARRQNPSKHQHGETGLPQVHAMNCLKDIFANSRLGSSAEIHLETTLQIAVDSLNHNIWSIRNCGGMLLKSILNRLDSGFGVTSQDNTEGHRSHSKAIFDKFPSLGPIIERLLELSLSSSTKNLEEYATEQVNHALSAMELILRVGVPKTYRRNVRQVLFQLLESPVWMVREHAATTLAHNTNLEGLMSTALDMLKAELLRESIRTNILHGLLLCLNACGELSSENVSKLKLARGILSLYQQMMTVSCPFVVERYLNLLTTRIYHGFDAFNHSNDWCSETKALFQLIEDPPPLLASSTVWHLMEDDHILQDAHDRLRVHLLLETSANGPVSSCPEVEGSLIVELLIRPGHGRGPELYAPAARAIRACASWCEDDLKEPTFADRVRLYTRAVTTKDIRLDIEHRNRELNTHHQYWPWNKYDFEATEAVLKACRNLRRVSREAAVVLLEFESSLINAQSSISGGTHDWNCLWREWTGELHFTMSEHLDTSLRLAAIQSVSNIREVLRQKLHTRRQQLIDDSLVDNRSIVCSLLTILYNGLVDDDAEVRDVATSTIAYVLWNNDVSPDPPYLTTVAARSQLIDWIVQQGVLVEILDSEALARLMDFPLDDTTTTTTSHTRSLVMSEWLDTGREGILHNQLHKRVGPMVRNIQDVLFEDPSLFGEERQNLYKDMVDDMQWWARILIATRSPKKRFSKIFEWVIFGLETIEHSEGSPGWTYRQEGFEAICRVLILAQVVQRWNRDSEYLRRLWHGVLGVEARLKPAHRYHTTLLEELKSGFETMGQRKEDQAVNWNEMNDEP